MVVIVAAAAAAAAAAELAVGAVMAVEDEEDTAVALVEAFPATVAGTDAWPGRRRCKTRWSRGNTHYGESIGERVGPSSDTDATHARIETSQREDRRRLRTVCRHQGTTGV